MFVQFSGSDEVLRALAAVGRTEDVQFSPDGKRLAIAGFAESRILILEVESMTAEPSWSLHFSRATIVKSASFSQPHGLTWADDEILIVANRHGQVPVIHAPRLANAPELLVHPISVLGTSQADFISTPGSVSLRPLGDGLIELLICNNSVHTVTRHYLDRDGFFAFVGGLNEGYFGECPPELVRVSRFPPAIPAIGCLGGDEGPRDCDCPEYQFVRHLTQDADIVPRDAELLQQPP